MTVVSGKWWVYCTEYELRLGNIQNNQNHWVITREVCCTMAPGTDAFQCWWWRENEWAGHHTVKSVADFNILNDEHVLQMRPTSLESHLVRSPLFFTPKKKNTHIQTKHLLVWQHHSPDKFSHFSQSKKHKSQAGASMEKDKKSLKGVRSFWACHFPLSTKSISIHTVRSAQDQDATQQGRRARCRRNRRVTAWWVRPDKECIGRGK